MKLLSFISAVILAIIGISFNLMAGEPLEEVPPTEITSEEKVKVEPSQEVIEETVAIDTVREEVIQEEVIQEEVFEDEEADIDDSSVWTKVKNGFVATGKYTWKGIKAGSLWIWKGISKGAFYMKEGAISFGEKMGMVKNQDETNYYEEIVKDARITLEESKTRREIRNRKYNRKQP